MPASTCSAVWVRRNGHADPLLLGGSWVVISGVLSPLIWVIIMVTLITTTLITNHEPPSRVGLWGLQCVLYCKFLNLRGNAESTTNNTSGF